MKRVFFYSFNGIHTPTLASLAYFKPENVEIEWFVHPPTGVLYSEFYDALMSVEQLGFNYQFLSSGHLSRIKNLYFKKFALKKFIIPFANKSLQREKVKVFVVNDGWWKYILNRKPDAVILPTVRLVEPSSIRILETLSRHVPLFLHEYGNTAKSISAFDLHKERHEFFNTIFTHGKVYQKQLDDRRINVKSLMTGSSKTDFYQMAVLFDAPVKHPFLLYCSSISHVNIYDDRASQPEKWVDILRQSCRLAGFDLIVKLHPSTLFLYKDEPWASIVYVNSYAADIFRQASGIISDPSSIMLESFLAEKPLFVPKLGIPEPSYLKPVIKVAEILTSDIKNNARKIRKITAEFRFSAAHKKIKLNWWHNPNGKVSKRIWKHILSQI